MHYAPEPTGNAPYVASLAQGLAARGHRVSVLTTHPHYPEWRVRDGYGGWTRRETIDGVRVTRLAHYVPRRPDAVRRLLSELSFGTRLLFARWARPDVVVLVSPALLASAVATMRGVLTGRSKSTAIWVQDLYSLGLKETGTGGDAAAAVLTAAEGWTFRRAAATVAIHDRFARYARNTLRVADSRLRVVRNWTHLGPQPHNDRAQTRARLGWSEHEFILLHAGNQGVKQGLENIVETAQLAYSRGSDLRFVFVGDGNQNERLRELARGLLNVQFVPPLDDEEYQRAMLSADALLVNERPGLNEMSVPSKLTSYFSTGVPVIGATDPNSVTAEEIRLSGGGLRADAGEPTALLAIIDELRAEPDRARELGRSGQAYRADVLGQDGAIDRFEQVLREVAGRRRS